MTIWDDTETLTEEDCCGPHGEHERCQGPVEYRSAPSGSSIPRCQRAFDLRWKAYEDSDLERYADSDVPPSWFDPSAIGEQWEDE